MPNRADSKAAQNLCRKKPLQRRQRFFAAVELKISSKENERKIAFAQLIVPVVRL